MRKNFKCKLTAGVAFLLLALKEIHFSQPLQLKNSNNQASEL